MTERKHVVVEEKELEEQTTEDVTPDNVDEADAKEAAPEDAEQDQTSGEASESEVETAEEKPKKKSFLGKEKKEKTNKLQEKVDELEDRVKRQMAEFDNFRKRSEKEKSAMFETGAKSVVEKILPVVDNFERGLAALSEEEMKQPFAEGMNMVYKQLITELEKLEVKPIEAVGCEFNPELHNAVMQVESEEYESGMIAQELQKGYTYRDSVVRHSMVAVVQ
ncbi:MAG: nucleotide exchange factor GrpE [Lachnospiraceae bacterium]|nr:nucleotide exchange factor GrpE [Lachnospiraceae bacterium]MCI8975076.1 nucleotide exchange factor GrpE [Lachnospiraceae bacterium]